MKAFSILPVIFLAMAVLAANSTSAGSENICKDVWDGINCGYNANYCDSYLPCREGYKHLRHFQRNFNRHYQYCEDSVCSEKTGEYCDGFEFFGECIGEKKDIYKCECECKFSCEPYASDKFWSEWSECSVSCGWGEQKRECMHPAGDSYCIGEPTRKCYAGECCENKEYYYDYDNDGYYSKKAEFCQPPGGNWKEEGKGADCNDDNAKISPGARELCDGIDNNCNNLIDEGYPNLGKSCSSGTGACERKGKYICSADGLSVVCNAVGGAPEKEACDGIDNNCNGLIDENCSNTNSDNKPAEDKAKDKPDKASNETEANPEIRQEIRVCSKDNCKCINNKWFCETDGKKVCSYSCTNESCEKCSPGECGKVRKGTDKDKDGFDMECGDCDDSNIKISPNAKELCDGIDNNCNGLIDEKCGAVTVDNSNALKKENKSNKEIIEAKKAIIVVSPGEIIDLNKRIIDDKSAKLSFEGWLKNPVYKTSEKDIGAHYTELLACWKNKCKKIDITVIVKRKLSADKEEKKENKSIKKAKIEKQPAKKDKSIASYDKKESKAISREDKEKLESIAKKKGLEIEKAESIDIKKQSSESIRKVIRSSKLNFLERLAAERKHKEIIKDVDIKKSFAIAGKKGNDKSSGLTIVLIRLKANKSIYGFRLYESIPKSVAENISELSFSRKPEIVNPDPLVVWQFAKLEPGKDYELSYELKKKAASEELEKSVTVAVAGSQSYSWYEVIWPLAVIPIIIAIYAIVKRED